MPEVYLSACINHEGQQLDAQGWDRGHQVSREQVNKVMFQERSFHTILLPQTFFLTVTFLKIRNYNPGLTKSEALIVPSPWTRSHRPRNRRRRVQTRWWGSKFSCVQWFQPSLSCFVNSININFAACQTLVRYYWNSNDSHWKLDLAR